MSNFLSIFQPCLLSLKIKKSHFLISIFFLIFIFLKEHYHNIYYCYIYQNMFNLTCIDIRIYIHLNLIKSICQKKIIQIFIINLIIKFIIIFIISFSNTILFISIITNAKMMEEANSKIQKVSHNVPQNENSIFKYKKKLFEFRSSRL